MGIKRRAYKSGPRTNKKKELTKIASGLSFDKILNAVHLDPAEYVGRDQLPHQVEAKLSCVLSHSTLSRKHKFFCEFVKFIKISLQTLQDTENGDVKKLK
jgi:hypothetical protein